MHCRGSARCLGDGVPRVARGNRAAVSFARALCNPWDTLFQRLEILRPKLGPRSLSRSPTGQSSGHGFHGLNSCASPRTADSYKPRDSPHADVPRFLPAQGMTPNVLRASLLRALRRMTVPYSTQRVAALSCREEAYGAQLKERTTTHGRCASDITCVIFSLLLSICILARVPSCGRNRTVGGDNVVFLALFFFPMPLRIAVLAFSLTITFCQQ